MSKSTKILAALVLLFAAIYAIQKITSRTSTTSTTHPFAGLDTAKITQLTISASNSVSLTKERGKWMMTSPLRYPADRSQVEMLISKIAGNPVGSIVAGQLSDSAAYGFKQPIPTLTLGSQDGNTIAIRIGGATPDYSGSYIQVVGDRSVLELAENFSSLVQLAPRDWRDKHIFSINSGDVRSADFDLADTAYHFVRNDTVWTVNGKIIPLDRGDQLVGSLVGAEAIDFIDSSLESSKTIIGFKLQTRDGRGVEGKIFKSAGLECLSSSADNQIFVVSPTMGDNISMTLREFWNDYLLKKRL